MLKIFYTTTAFQLLFFGLVVIASKHKKQFHYWMSALLFIQSIVFILTVGRWHYNVIPDTQSFRLLKVLFESSFSSFLTSPSSTSRSPNLHFLESYMQEKTVFFKWTFFLWLEKFIVNITWHILKEEAIWRNRSAK